MLKLYIINNIIYIVSLISSIIMLLLFLNEFASHRRLKTSSEIYIDVNRGGDKLKVNLDIDVPNLPCSLISIDIEDAMGAIP